ncbi:hypothetical protein [Streptomyces sp. HUAS ZL42]|uniref:hypothetical protein n=1 Tax=Streptomyces sp. HUAS ZL42 TaxID=3231715 RepID=UPI00345E8BB4
MFVPSDTVDAATLDDLLHDERRAALLKWSSPPWLLWAVSKSWCRPSWAGCPGH